MKQQTQPAPCPFCGRRPEVHSRLSMMSHRVQCRTERCVMGQAQLREYTTRAAAVRGWNRWLDVARKVLAAADRRVAQ